MTGPSAENISHVGRKARMLSGNGLSRRIGSPSVLPLLAKRIFILSMVLNCMARKPVLLFSVISFPLFETENIILTLRLNPGEPNLRRGSPRQPQKTHVLHFPIKRLLQ